MVLATFAVQGVTYAVQLALAPLLGPIQFGLVRAAEAVAASGALVAAAGMPALMMRYVAERSDAGWRRYVAGAVLRVAAIGGSLTAAVLLLLAPWLTAPEMVPYVRWLAISVAVTAVSRSGVTYFFGAGIPQRVPRITIPLAVLTALFVISGAASFGLYGWVAGRVLADLVMVVVVTRAVIAAAGPAASRDHDARLSTTSLARSGVPLALSLVARTTMDNASVLVLAREASDPQSLGVVGLVSLASSALLVIPSGVVTLGLPRMVQRAGTSRTELSRYLNRLVMLATALTLVPALGLVWIGQPLVGRWLPAYAPGLETIVWLVLTTAPRVASSLAGTALLSVDRPNASLVVTTASLGVMVPLQIFATRTAGVTGLVLATLAAELASALAFLIVAHRLIHAAPPRNGA